MDDNDTGESGENGVFQGLLDQLGNDGWELVRDAAAATALYPVRLADSQRGVARRHQEVNVKVK
jgi:hypothetical protein